jgi:hypothetical protein
MLNDEFITHHSSLTVSSLLLGLHPHIASCYYVRNLGGIPRMFIEYADAGTLRSDECGTINDEFSIHHSSFIVSSLLPDDQRRNPEAYRLRSGQR